MYLFFYHANEDLRIVHVLVVYLPVGEEYTKHWKNNSTVKQILWWKDCIRGLLVGDDVMQWCDCPCFRQVSLEMQKETAKRQQEEEAWYRQQQLLLEAEDKRRRMIQSEEQKLVDQRKRSGINFYTSP